MKTDAVSTSLAAPEFLGGRLRQYSSVVGFGQRVADAGIIAASAVVAMELMDRQWSMPVVISVALAVAAFYLLAEAKGFYRSRRMSAIRPELWAVLEAWLVVLGVSLLALHVQGLGRPPEALLLWLGLTPVNLCLWRVVGRYLLRVARRHGFNTRRLAIVGRSAFAHHVDRALADNSWTGYRVVGIFDDARGRPARRRGNDDEIRSLSALLRLARNGGVDVIHVVLSPGVPEQAIANLLTKLSDCTISVYLIGDRRAGSRRDGAASPILGQMQCLPWLHPCRFEIGDLVAYSIYETPFLGPYGWVKRLEDLCISSAALVLLALPMVLIAIGVKLSSPGPVLFKQRRYGLDGRKILVWKFRSMTVCEDGIEVGQAKRNDPRVTPFGCLLRRTSLDELPQLINVFRGSMSIVGPRPHAVAHNEYYRGLVEGYMLRHKVKPGITGWAQVNGFRGETSSIDLMRGRVELDLDYIRRWSLWLDLRIIVRTMRHGFVHQNAY